MQINFINQNTTFKQIKLSEAELEKAKDNYKYVLAEPKNANHNYKMFDLFESHLNNEVDLKQYKTGKERKYFSANLYIKFFEILNSTKNKKLPLEVFINNLNNYINKFYIKNTPETDYIKLKEYNVTSAKIAAYYMHKYLEMPKEDFLKLAQKTPFFANTTCSYLKMNVENLINNLGFTEQECIELYKRNPDAMIFPSNWLIENANKTMETLNIETLENLRMILKSNPNLLTFQDLENSIKNISEFLDIEKDSAKTMIKSQPYLATTKLNHIKNNFYSMKDLIKVDKNKMVEIAIMSPATITIPFDLNKQKYENIAKTLHILPETFYHKANSLPAIYRITPTKLEKYIDFVSEKLNFSREEAISYIAQNLNILSYKYNNMINRAETNFKILNKNLNIDYEAFIYMLEENAWVMGHKEEYINKNLNDVQNYYNVDNKTLARMLERNPKLITTFIENVDQITKNVSKYLNISEDQFKYLCIIEPLLATRSLNYNKVNIQNNANILNMSEEKYIELGKINPTLFIKDFDTIEDLKERIDFSNLIMPNDNKIDLSNPAINNEESLFEEILLTTLTIALGLSAKEKKINIKDILSKCKNSLVEINVPQHNLTKSFINYAKDFIKNYNLESKCKLIVKR